VSVWSWGQYANFPPNFTVVKQKMLHAMDFEQNNNKFYYMEIHQAPQEFDGNFKFRVFTHNGRTDELELKKNVGQRQCRYCFTEREAQLLYLSILKEKTSEEKGYKTIHLLSISNKIGTRT
jgi:predicted DNA-binding WGR domain protein